MPGILRAIGGGNAYDCEELERELIKDAKFPYLDMIGINCDAETFNDDFRLERFKFDIENSARAYLHYVLSYRLTDKLSVEEILEQSKKLVERIDKFKGHQVAIIYHSSTNSISHHCHIVVNAVNSKTGKKLSVYWKDLSEAKEILISLDEEKGLGKEEKKDKNKKNIKL